MWHPTGSRICHNHFCKTLHLYNFLVHISDLNNRLLRSFSCIYLGRALRFSADSWGTICYRGNLTGREVITTELVKIILYQNYILGWPGSSQPRCTRPRWQARWDRRCSRSCPTFREVWFLKLDLWKIQSVLCTKLYLKNQVSSLCQIVLDRLSLIYANLKMITSECCTKSYKGICILMFML